MQLKRIDTRSEAPYVPRRSRVTAADSDAVARTVSELIKDVVSRGNQALVELSARFDGHAPSSLEGAIDDAISLPAELAPVLRAAAANIRAYQTQIVHKTPESTGGIRDLGVRYTPVDRVGVYVPGGKAFYPSSLLMTVVPAQVAGVREIVVCSPARDGRLHPTLVALCAELGVDALYPVGGAQAIAAMAYGTETIRPVDMIVGPGNAYVAEAKRQVLGQVGIDAIAGPSEVLIIADASADARAVAVDMMSQAEHDPGSALLVTPSEDLAAAVEDYLGEELAQLERAEAIRRWLSEDSAIVLCPNLEAACEIANAEATEHLQLMTADDEGCLARIRHAGAIFVGPHSPVALGDYWAGPSHVLPTSGSARFFGPLSANSFLKASSVIRYAAAALLEDADAIAAFAEHEGLTAHARSIRVRQGS